MGRGLRPKLARGPSPASLGEPLRNLSDRALRIELLLRLFYGFFPFWFVIRLPLLQPLLQADGTQWAWPVLWIGWLNAALWGPELVLGFGILAALLCALAPEFRVFRIALAFAMLEVLALKYSFGKVHHLMHGWLYVALIFAALLPDSAFYPKESTRKQRAYAQLIFHVGLTMIGLTYSLAGVGKLLGAIYQLALGQITPLHPSALARHVADRLLQTYPESILGPVMISHGTWLWPMMLATIYLQLVAVVAVFRPRLHRLWGFGLLGFHMMTALSMTIDFSPQLMLVALFFLASPFVPSDWPRRFWEDLPGLEALSAAIINRTMGGGRSIVGRPLDR